MCMNRRSFLGSSVALLGGPTLGSGAAQDGKSHLHRVHAAPLVTECASRFLAALDPDQRGKATFAFDTDERMNWHFIPKERKGLSLREMTPYQKHLASALLAAGLSQTGYIKAVTIMSLEDVLKIIENDSGEHRNPEKYYCSSRFEEPCPRTSVRRGKAFPGHSGIARPILPRFSRALMCSPRDKYVRCKS